MTHRRTDHGARVRAAGYTLVEIMISITVAAVLGVGVMGLVLGQQRFYRHSDDTIVAQQNLRAALDLVASEIRMASPTDVIVATADSVAVRTDVIRSVVCDVTGPDEIAVFVYDSVGNANLTPSFRGTAYSGAYDSAFVYRDGWTPAATGSGGSPEATCVANGAPTGQPAHFYRRLAGWNSQFGEVPSAGSIVRSYGKLSYRFSVSNFSNGLGIWRNGQELVAPFENGARFRYVMRDNSVQDYVPVADLADIRTVRIVAAAMGDGVDRYGVRRRIEFDVPLRN
jgi:type II secretory pathway pseudopilin PulG